MSSNRLKSEYGKEKLSLGCVLVSAVFFLVLSQVFILKVPDIVTQFFRPLILVSLLILMTQRGQIGFNARTISLIAAIYYAVIVLFYRLSTDNLKQGAAVVLYLLMFFTVSGVPWNRREIQTIVMACFIAAFVCSIAIFMSNDLTDLHVGTSGEMNMLGVIVNRNKNAYAFALGTIIGTVYLLYGKRVPRFLILLLTAVTLYGVLYSQCRGAFFCTSLAVIILVFGKLLDMKKQNAGKFLLYTVLFIIFCIAVYFILKNSELSRLIDGESKSGRDDGIRRAWQMFLSSDMFGKIFGNGYGYEIAHTDDGIGAHLVYATYLVSSGIIGSGLIICMFLSSFLRVKGAIPYAFFGFAFLRTFFEGLDYYIYIPLLLSVIIYNYSLIYGRDCSELFSRK